MEQSDRISYGRILSSFARELDAEEVEQLVFIYLRDSGNAPVDCNAKGAAFRVLMKLERLSRFSFEDPAGLVRIATDAGRLDWKKKFEQYIASRRNPLPKRKGGSRTPLPSKEQEQLEDAHREVRARFIAVEEQFSKLWSRETVTKEDGLKLLRRGKKLTKEIECELEKGIEKLKTLTRDSDSLSSSGSSSSIELSTSPEASSSLTSRSRGERNRDVPLPKPRKPMPPPPYKQKYKAAVQEKTRHNSPMLKPSNKIDSLQAPDQPPPVPPKKQHSSRISGTRQSAMSQMCFNKASVCIPQQKKESDEEESKEVAVEEGDQTGDSGMESGSGSVQHGTISQWREAIKKPPPEPRNYPPKEGEKMDECVSETKKRYTHLREETIDRVGPYEKVNYGSPLS
jgi:hypothetical protein